MVNLAQAWAEAYKSVNPAVNVEVSGGGSGVGIAALIKGAIDIANASRNMKPGEIDQAVSMCRHVRHRTFTRLDAADISAVGLAPRTLGTPSL